MIKKNFIFVLVFVFSTILGGLGLALCVHIEQCSNINVVSAQTRTSLESQNIKIDEGVTTQYSLASTPGIPPGMPADDYAIVMAGIGQIKNYFENNGYTLAYELLDHSLENMQIDSYYTPDNMNIIGASEKLGILAFGNSDSGSTAFPNTGTQQERDLFFSINKFNYTRVRNANSVTVTITDRYDYDFENDYEDLGFIGTTAVNVLALAQTWGILTPFQLNLSFDFYDPVSTINTAQQLDAIRNNPFGDYRLGSNISLSAYTNWSPIPNFFGTFEGNNFIISSLKIVIPNTEYSTEQYLGLFGNIHGTVTDLCLTSVNITGASRHSGATVNVGAVAGRIMYGAYVSDVFVVNGTIDVDRVNSRVGGIVGENLGHIISAINFAKVMGVGDLGGIAATNRVLGFIENSTNGGTVSYWLGSTVRSVGGIVGFNEQGLIMSNTNTGHIEARNIITAKANMGTVIGHNVGTFYTTNTNNGTWHAEYTSSNGFLGIGKYDNSTYLFKQYNGRVGRQS